MWLIRRDDYGRYQVGYYMPTGEFFCLPFCSGLSDQEAAMWVNYLNGGSGAWKKGFNS